MRQLIVTMLAALFFLTPCACSRKKAVVKVDQVAERTKRIETATAALKDSNPTTRHAAATTLGREGAAASEAVPALTELAKKDKDVNVKRAAAEAVKQIQGK